MNQQPKTVLILEEDYVNYLLFREYFDDYKIRLVRIHHINQIYHNHKKMNIHAVIFGDVNFNAASAHFLSKICEYGHFPVFIEKGTTLDKSGNISGMPNCWIIDLFSDEKDIISIIENYSSLALADDVAFEMVDEV
ncbi:MAG: hypothetical protein GVY19_02175 [Bacteroidetes bacterium]|jgi:hypothetical protein|nr:hypothetical protein [Bacteroidota bacterium]